MIVTAMKCKLLWRKRNKHNLTRCTNFYEPQLIDQVIIGNYTYGEIQPQIANKKNKLIIGSYCSIGSSVAFIVSVDHSLRRLSTYPFKANVLLDGYEGESKGDIVIDDDVWIGHGAAILSGVHVGQGAIIGTGAVVTKDVPAYAVVAGVPARIMKYRFSDSVIRFLLTLDYSKLTKDMVKEHEKDLYVDIDQYSLQEIENVFLWFPKK